MCDMHDEGPSTSRASTKATADSASDIQPIEVPTSSIRSFPKIPVFIVEDHNDVLHFFIRCFGSRHLPLEENKIIHFDAHPDMCIPKGMPARYVYAPDDLLGSISIENWLMPMVFAGHLDRIVWIKPEWSDQMQKGKYQFNVGEFEGCIRTDSTLEYFVSEGCYQPEEDLENKRDLRLEVCSITEYKVGVEDDLKGGYILDIDLDYFSTLNPFLYIYERVGLYERLKEIFVSPELAEIAENDLERLQRIARKREEKLEFLESIFLCLEENGNLRHFVVDHEEELDEEKRQLVEKVSNIVALLEREYANEKKINWSQIYDAGSTCDIIDLPHHRSTREEIQAMIIQFESFLASIPPPTVITISRSTLDDYTPIDQVEMIQELVLAALEKRLSPDLDEPSLYYVNKKRSSNVDIALGDHW